MSRPRWPNRPHPHQRCSTPRRHCWHRALFRWFRGTTDPGRSPENFVHVFELVVDPEGNRFNGGLLVVGEASPQFLDAWLDIWFGEHFAQCDVEDAGKLSFITSILAYSRPGIALQWHPAYALSRASSIGNPHATNPEIVLSTPRNLESFPVCKQYLDTALEQFAVHLFADTHAIFAGIPDDGPLPRQDTTLCSLHLSLWHRVRPVGCSRCRAAKGMQYEGGFFIGQCF